MGGNEQEVPMPTYVMTLHKTYYRMGFFNVPVDYDRYVRPDEGPIRLMLGATGEVVNGKVNRSANRNGTARVMGRVRLRDWFRRHFDMMDRVDVEFLSPDLIQLRRSYPAV